MAIVMIGMSECPICGEVIDDRRPYVATSGAAFPSWHELFPFCDVALHLDCLVDWPDRARFAQVYYDRDYEYHQTLGGVLIDAGDWVLLCGPAAPGEMPYYLRVVLRDWPVALKVESQQWEALLAGFGVEQWRSTPIEPVVGQVIAQLAQRLPDQEALEQLYDRRATLILRSVPEVQPLIWMQRLWCWLRRW